jgi:flagellar hook-associated protein 1 FlgK
MGMMGLEIGKRGLQAHQTAMDVTGHNISNANTEGYSRQIPTMTAQYVEDSQYGTMGAGADVTSVVRVRDEFLDDRIIEEATEKSYWETKETNMRQIQYIINEPTDESVRFTLDEYWKSLQNLSQAPEDMAMRVDTKERAQDLTDTINKSYDQLYDLQADLNNEVKVLTEDINSKLKQIAQLNDQINKIELTKDSANDLKDSRDLLVEDLSKDIDLRVERGSENEFIVTIGGRAAVQGNSYQQLEAVKNTNSSKGFYKVIWSDIPDREVNIQNGEIKSIMDLRDIETTKYMEDLDELAIGLIDQVNDVNSSGFDINGNKGGVFFEPFTSKDFLVDKNQDGIMEVQVYKLRGDNLIAEPSEYPLENDPDITSATGKIKLNGIEITYDTSEDSMEDIVNRINDANSGVEAALDPNNRFVLRAAREEDYTFRTIEDVEGSLLQELGIFVDGASAFSERDESTLDNLTTDRLGAPKEGTAMRIDLGFDNVDEIAASKGKINNNGEDLPVESNGIGDGTNALQMSNLKYQNAIGNHTFEEYFEALVSDLGIKSEQAARMVDNQETLIANLEEARQSQIGVSLDEEMTNLIRFEQGYNAAAKYIQAVNQMLDTLINRL